MKMELIEGSETSAISNSDTGELPKRKHITFDVSFVDLSVVRVTNIGVCT